MENTFFDPTRKKLDKGRQGGLIYFRSPDTVLMRLYSLLSEVESMILSRGLLIGLAPVILSLFIVRGHALGNILSWQLLLVFIAFAFTRTSGMLLNRYIDRSIDQANPRTISRSLPAGRISETTTLTLIALSLSAQLLTYYLLGGLCRSVAIPVTLLIIVYPYAKRFTAACHFLIGAIHSLGPFLAYAAFYDHIPWNIALLAFSWGLGISGGDIIYSLSDYEHDRSHGIYSLPALIGRSLAQSIGCVLLLLSLVGVSLVLATSMGNEITFSSMRSPVAGQLVSVVYWKLFLDRAFAWGYAVWGAGLLYYVCKSLAKGDYARAFELWHLGAGAGLLVWVAIASVVKYL